MFFRVAVLLGALSLSAVAQSSTAEETKIKQLESKYYAAFEAGRWDEMAGIETEDFIVQSDSLENKTDQMEGLRKSKPLQQQFKIADQHFQNLRGVVVVSYNATFSGGNEKPVHLTLSEVWNKQGENWKLAHLHFSELESSGTQATKPKH